jgi:hypothetical protein
MSSMQKPEDEGTACRVSGRVTEAESDLGVPGLIVRALDKDMLFDDLLGSVITSSDGSFEIRYLRSDFGGLFEAKPDIYLSVYAPPLRWLADTKKSVRCNAGVDERFSIVLDRAVLGTHSPATPADRVESRLKLPDGALKIVDRAGFDFPVLPGFKTHGVPGAPALPIKTEYVLLPSGGDIRAIEIDLGQSVRLSGRGRPMPVQEPVPDVGTDGHEFGDGVTAARTRIPFTPLNRRQLATGKAFPEKLVEVIGVEDLGPVQLATIRVTAAQYEPGSGAYLFYPNLSYQVIFDTAKARTIADERRRQKATIGVHKAEMLTRLTESQAVLSPALDLPFVLIDEDYPHLIITDSFLWPESIALADGTTRPPTIAERGAALPGDMIAEFERLAEWKTAKGMRSRVVTVSQIVSGTFGNFTQDGFARDLQEVIRNFAKHAYKNWGTMYLLIGGDVEVVPIRKVAGSGRSSTFGCGRTSENPPDAGKCRVVGTVVKIHPDFTPMSGQPLSSFNGALRIPFDREAGAGRLGWYFTSEEDFSGKNAGFERLAADQTSHFVIVEGPAAVLDDDYYWVRDNNSIPTDFYYSSLDGPGYSISGKHDFDANNNGLYGQLHQNEALDKNETLDGLDDNADVWVGRASTASAAEAAGFVNKVMTYERLRDADDTPVDTGYLQKVLYAADWWGRVELSKQNDTSTSPEEDHYTYADGATQLKINNNFNIEMDDETPTYRLVGITGTTRLVIPYNTSASATNLGWFFCTNNNYTTQSAVPTRFVRARGPAANLDQGSYLWDPIGLEGCTKEKEAMRALMNSYFPGFGTVARFYSDIFDLNPPPPLAPLDAVPLNASLDEGQHFVSLSGHGSASGCCHVSRSHDFSNQDRYFIAFANSCSTARPDGPDSLAEKSTYDPNGGAVAYVGNSRYGWIGVGDNYEEAFWCLVKNTGRVGPAACARLASGGVRSLWTVYAQNLFGDPEMPVWIDTPETQEVTLAESAARGSNVTITVRHFGVPVKNHRVTLMGGWQNSAQGPRFYATKKTGADGKASFTLAAPAGVDTVRVTITKDNFRPFEGSIGIT